MAIIGQVERKNWKVKFLNIMIHTVLIIGAATMVYPLLLMLSGSVKSSVDFKNFSIVPEYLSSDVEGKTLLFRKYLLSKYNNKVLRMSGDLKDPNATFDTVEAPVNQNAAKLTADYAEFLAECKQNRPHYWFLLGMALEQGIDALSVRNYRQFMQEKVAEEKDGLQKLNQMFDTQYAAWDELALPAEDFIQRRSVTDYSTGLLKTIHEFKYSQYVDPMVEVWFDLEGDMIAMLRRDCGRNLKQINEKLGTDYNSWSEITVSAVVPENNPALALMWEEFVKNEINLDFIKVDPVQAAAPWQAYLKEKYKDIASVNKILNVDYKDFSGIEFPAVKPAEGVIRTDWQDFVKANSTVDKLWNDYLKKKYRNQIADLNRAYGTAFKDFNSIPVPGSGKTIASGENGKTAVQTDIQEVAELAAKNRMRELPASAITVDSLAIRYRDWIRKRFGGSIDALNNAYCNGYVAFDRIPLNGQPEGEKNLAQTADWNEFVRTLKPEDIALMRQTTSDYKAYLKSLYTDPGTGKCDYAKLAADYDCTIRDGEDNDIPAYLAYPGSARATDKARQDYIAAITGNRFPNMLMLKDPERFSGAWHDFLKKKYGNIAGLNAAWHLTPQSFDRISLPVREYEWSLMEQNISRLRSEYLKRNYLMVFNTLFTNGNAAFNTLLYCFLAVLAALLVNPLCAYGLSRYKPASSYKILLFLMLPMAFPGMVLGIPQFLLIKNFGLLNTFAALILPGMANGYSIFLLKGFFDSLPKELFESAAIDGASEWTVFWHIAMGLSTPILSVIALGAFTGAYGNFMMAFLLCQDKDMWTMMVYLYQLQQRAAPAVGFAALAVAAIPTLIVFVFCQNIIIKGIVVPTEK